MIALEKARSSIFSAKREYYNDPQITILKIFYK